MNSFTSYIFNKAPVNKWQRPLQLVLVVFFLFAFHELEAQPCPVASPVAPITICSGTVTGIVLSSDQPGTTYTWTTVQTDVVGASDCASGCGSTIIDTLTAIDVFQGSVDYTVTSFANGCFGAPIVVTVAVNPIPLAIASNSTICSGATSSVAITSDVAGTTFAWTVIQAGVSGASPGSGSLIAQTLNTTGPSSGIATYNIIPTAANCVGEPINTKVTVRQLPSLTPGANPEVCQGTTTANLTYSSPGGSPNQYSVNYDAAAEAQGFVDVVGAVLPASPIVLVVPGGAAIGTYNAILTVNNTVNGCPGASYPITVTINEPPTISDAGLDQTPACGITAVTLDGNPPLVGTGSWSIFSGAGGSFVDAADPTTIFSGTAGTSYILIWTISNDPCPASTDSVTISFNQNPTPAAAGPDQALCDVSTTLAANTPVAGTGSWSISSGAGGSFVLATDPGTVFNGVAETTYVLVWTITNPPCDPSTDTVIIVFSGTPVVVTNDPTAICSPATADLTLPAVTAGSTAGLTFTYYTNPGATIVYPNPETATAGTYYIVGTALSGCADTTAVTVIINTTPTLVTVPQSICSPDTTADLTLASVTAGSTPGLTFTYFTDPGATLVYASPDSATAGTYYIVGTLGGACSDTAGVDVTVNPSPTVITNDQNVCSPAIVDLTAPEITVGSTGGLTFSYFTDAAATNPYGTPTNATTGTYYIVGVTPAGCSDTTPVIVNIITTPTVVTVPQSACSPATVNLTLAAVTAGSTPGLTYTYFNDAAATDPYLTPTLATTGTYYIVGTNGTCSDTTPVTVTINPKPTVVTNNPATVCAPATVDLTDGAVTAGSTGGLSFTYFTDAGATISYGTPATATAGTYYIVGTDFLTGCSDTTAVTVTITPKPTVVTAPQNLCSPATADLTLPAVTAGSTGGLSFTYFTDSDATIAVVDPTDVGAGTYYIVGSTVGGCSDTTAVTVTINASPTVITNDPAAACSPATVDLTDPAVTAGSTGGLSYTYFTDAGATNPYLTPGTATSGTYYIVGAIGGCSDTTAVTVTIDPSPTVIAAPLSLCLSGTVDLTDPDVTEGSTPGLTFTYFTDPGATVAVGDPTAVGAGTYYIVGTVPATGCADTTSIEVTLAPTVLTTDQSSCFPDTLTDLTIASVTSGSTPGLTYTYFTDAGATIPVADETNAAEGIYYIVGTTVDGCADTTEVTYTVNPKPTVITVPQTACAPSTVDLTLPAVTAGSTPFLGYFYFTNVGATISYPTPAAAGAGTYYILGMTGFGCSDTTAITVTIDAQPTLITVNQSACSPISTTDLTLPAVTAGSTGGLDYTYFTDAAATISYGTPGTATAGTYYIVGTIPGGCSDTAAVTFTVNPKPTVVTVAQSICSPGTINLTLPAVTAGSTGGLTFTYFTDAAATLTYGTPTTAGDGTYYIVGTSAANCSDTTAIVVTIDPKPTLVTVPQSVCSPATSVDLTLAAVTAGSTAGLSFTYFTDPGITSPYGTPAAATTGTYYIVGVTPEGCADTASVTVAINPKPTVVTVPQPICSPATTVDLTLAPVTAGSTPGLSFTYFTDAGATSTYATPSAATAGTYYIVGVTLAGCSDTTAVTVTVNPKPTVITNDPAPICSPATVDLTLPAVTLGSTGSLTFSYYTDAAATSVYATPATAPAGTYYIVGMTLAGCSDTTAVNVISDAIPTVVTVPQVICSPSVSVDLTLPGVTAGSTAGLTFAIYSDIGATTLYGTPTAATVGTYYIVGSTPGGCTDTTPVTVTLDPGANAGTVTGISPLCIGATDTYTSDGDIGGSWTSTDPSVATVIAGTGVVTAVSDGTTDITYTVNGCSGPVSSFLTLTVDPDANAGLIGGTSPLCIGSTDTYTSTGDAGGTWTSTDPAVATVDPGLGLVTALSAGTTDITYTVLGCNGPSDAILTLTVDPDANVGIVSGLSPLCITDTDIYTSTGDAGGAWSSSDPLVASVDPVSGLVTALTAGTTDITYTIPGCNGVAFQTLTVSPDADAGIVTGTTPLCIGATDTYTSDGDAGGSWSSTDPLVATVVAGTGLVTTVSAGTTDITYTVTGCNSPASFLTLTVSPDANPGTVSGTTPLCIGATDTYTSDGDAGGSWSSTDPLVATVNAVSGLVTAVGVGTTNITYSLNSGCNNPVSSFLTLTVSPNANAGTVSGTSPLCIGATDTYTSDGDAGGSWSSTDPAVATVNALTGLVTAITAGTTNITYTLNSGCNNPVSSFLTLTVSPDANPGTVSGTTPLCIGATDTYTSDGDAGGTWSSTDPAVATVDPASGLVTALSAGTTDITYTLILGCNSPAAPFLTLTVSPDANPGTVSGTTPLCIGATDTYTSDGEAGGTWSSTDPLVATVVAGTGLVTAVSAGTTDITYTLNSGCNSPVSSFLTLTVNPDVTAGTVSGTTPLCTGASDTYTSDGDIGGTWTSTNPLIATVVAGTGVVTAIAAGTTDITYTVNGCNGPATSFLTLTVDPTNSGTITGTTPLCIGATDTYTSDGSPGGSWASTDPLVASVDAGSGLVTALAAGTTDITYTLIGCSTSSLLTLTVNPDVSGGVISGTTPLCIGASDTYTTDGDIGGSWSSTDPLVATVIAGTGVVTAVSAGTTDITYTVNGCNGPATAFATLTVSPDINAGAVTGASPLCIGATDTYTTDGDGGGSWTSTDPLVATVIAGTGFVTAVSVGTTDITYTVNGCNGPASAFLTLTVDPDVNPGTVSGTTPLCIGATDTYTSDGEPGGTWSSTNPLVATVIAGTGVVTAVSAGTTDITYTVNSGCNNPLFSFLTLTVSPDVNAGTVSGLTPLCIGTTDTYTSDGDPGGSWSSTDPLVATVNAGTGLVTAVAAGTTDITYTVTGCNGPAFSILTLTVDPTNSGTITGTTPLCIGATDPYTSDGDPGGTWASSDPAVASVIAGTGVVTALTAGTTDITYTLLGCSISSVLTLTVDPDVNAGNLTGITPLCMGTSDTYTSDGDPGGSWSSTDPLVATVDAVTGLVTALTAGTTDISYTVTGCNGPDFVILTLTVDPTNSGTVSGLSPLCIGATDTYITDGTAGGSWASTDPLVATVDAASGLVTAVSAGTTNITYTLVGCNASSSFALTVDPDANAGTLTITSPLCIGASDTFTSDGDAGGNWSSSDPLVATIIAGTGVVTAVSAGTTDITYIVMGCNGPSSVLVTLTVSPDVNAGTVSGLSPLCIGATDTYTSDGDAGGSWSSTNPLIATVIAGTGVVTAVSAGTTDITYTVTGCNGPASSLLTLTVDPDANAGTVSGTSPLCIGGTDTYTSDGDIGGTWSSTDPLIATVVAGTGLVTAVSAGTTDITYTVSSGCNNPVSSFLTLTVSPDVNAGIISGTTPLCIGATDTYTSDGDAGGSWSSTDPLIATVIAGTGVVTTVSAGTTDITYTVNGCNGPASAFLTLTVNPDVNAGTVSGTTPLCIGATDTYTSDGDAGGSWSSTDPLIATVIAGTGLVTAVSAGTTDITYTVNGCNGPVSSFQTLTVDPDASSGSISGTTPLCIGATDTFTSDGDAGGSWSSTDPLVATVIAGTGVVTAVSAGTTDITYTVSSGCNNPVSSILTLTVSPDVNAGIVSGISPLCVGATGTFTSDGDLGGSWSSTDPLVATVIAGTGVVTAVSAGTTDITYTVTGCNGPASAFLSLTVNSSPDVTASGTNLTCFGVCNGTAIATVTGGNPLFAYVWSTGTTDTTASVTDTITGLCVSGYTVTVTDANGCSDTDSVTLTEPTPIIPNITTGNVSCNGICDGESESSPTGGTAPYTFAWNTGSVDTLITNLCPGIYTVIVTDSLSCTATLNDTVLQVPSISGNAVISNATCGLCNGQVVLAPSGGLAPYTFVWSNGEITNTASNLCAGLYSVSITDDLGCGSNFSIPVSNPGGPTDVAITSTNISCFGLCDGAVTAVTPVGGTPPYSILWIPGGQTSPTLSNLCAGVYYVQVADSVGCSLIDSVTITEPSQMVVNQFITASACGACDGSISIAPSGGVSPYTVLWSTGAISDTVSNLCAGFYSVQVTDAAGCTENVVIPVNSLNAPTLTISGTSLLCNGACNATATVVANGGILPYSYLWNDPAAQTTDIATALCAGNYFVQVTGGGCVAFAPVTITNPAPIGFAFANTVDPLCNGNTNGSIAVIPFGGTLPYSYSWTGSGSVSDTASGLSSGTYTVTVTDANGCTAAQTNTLVNPDSITIANVVTNASCNTIADGAIDITVGGGSPGYSYQWSGGSSLTTQDLTGILSGNYTITVTDTNGCSLSEDIIVLSSVTVTAVAGNDTAFCEPGTLLLNASGSSANVINYQWFQIQVPADVLVGSVMNISLTPPPGVTNYYVIVDNGAGCSHSDTITVTVNILPVVDAGADVTIIGNSTTVIGGNPTGPAGSTYLWTPAVGLDNDIDANPIASPIATTTYTVNVVSPEGCTSSDVITVTVIANITFANGISPNGDGANDEWIIDNIDLFPGCVVEIYNRWGEMLFQSQGYKEKWTGIYKGQMLPIGTYYYIIDLKEPLFPDAYTGPITLLR